MKAKLPHHIKTISQYHQAMGLPKPEHPLISILNFDTIPRLPVNGPLTFIYDFYSIYLKRITNVKFKYGQQESDFDEGVLFFMAPNQVFSIEAEKSAEVDRSGWIMLIHPDFLWNTPLASTIKQYEFFGYSVNEALYLSPREEKKILGIIKNIRQEYDANIDRFSQGIIISHLEVLLNYAERFYNRQFITRKVSNHKVLITLEEMLTKYFNSDLLAQKGLPSVQYVAGGIEYVSQLPGRGAKELNWTEHAAAYP